VLLNKGIFKDNYLVSNMGRVKYKKPYKNGKTQYVLLKVIDSERPVVRMSSNGKRYTKSVAKLVLSSFQYRDGCECANITYLDGNMKNCTLSNLRYAIDKDIYKTLELETKEELKKKRPYKRKRVRRTAPKPVLTTKMSDGTEIIRSCSTCRNSNCFEGMENLSSDFGAEGCHGYKPRIEE
jgi:hypothetical protein